MDATQHPLDAIASGNIIPAAKEQLSRPDATGSDTNNQSENTSKEPPSMGNRSVRSTTSVPHVLKLSGLNSPAIILDKSLRVIWQNRLAIDHIWCRSRTANNGNPTPDIFDLLFDQHFRQEVDNWRQWVSFFTWHMTGFIPSETLKQRLDQMSGRQKDMVSAIATRQKSESAKGYAIGTNLRQIRSDGDIQRFEAATIDFNEGRLFVFVAQDNQKGSPALAHSQNIQRRYDFFRSRANPVKVEFSVLAARLNHAGVLKTQLLADEYCRLVNDICRISIDIAETHGGCIAKHSDSALSAYFLRLDEEDDETAVDTIRCALAIKNRMIDLSREWKLRKSWTQDIALNIGIHHDIGYMGIIRSSVGDSLSSFGDALNIASELAALSQNGEIWATKPLIAGMMESARTKLRFGIQHPDSYRHYVLIQNSFAKVRDLQGADQSPANLYAELQDVAVAQIFDLEV